MELYIDGHQICARPGQTLLELVQELGLDVPQPTALCAALRAQGIDLPAGVLTPEQCAEELLKRIHN